jgi:hypothetical protein
MWCSLLNSTCRSCGSFGMVASVNQMSAAINAEAYAVRLMGF